MAAGHRDDGEVIPATIGQRLLWLMAHYRGGNGAMNVPIIYRLHGRLDEAALSAALAELTRRHESLRSTVSRQAGRLTQHIHQPRPVPVRGVDMRGGTERAVGRALVDELRTEIPPGSWPVRVTLYRTGPDDYLLCLVIHHYVTDGWSNAVLREELWQLYDQIASGRRAELPPVSWQYGDFARWQADREGSPAWRAHESYWRQRLDGVRLPRLPGSVSPARVAGPPAGPRLPAGRPPGLARSQESGGTAAGRAGVETFHLADTTVSALEKLAARERATLFTAMLATFYLWLHEVTGEADLAVGSMFANRLHPEAIRAVGFFANLVALRTVMPGQGTFLDLLRATRETVNGALDHQEVPCQMVRTGPSGPPARGSLRPEDLMFQMQPWPVDEHRLLTGAQAWQLPPPEGVITRFAFECFMWPATAGGLLGHIVFAEERFSRSWVRQAATGFQALVTRVAATPGTPLPQLR